MNKRTWIFLGGIGIGVSALLWVRRIAQSRRLANLHLTTENLDYQDVPREELSSAHLIDLNDAEAAGLAALNLRPESLERLIENRPYRSKLELVSRMVLTEAEYETIRDKVGIAEGREPVKIA